jgi:hypothetical protein
MNLGRKVQLIWWGDGWFSRWVWGRPFPQPDTVPYEQFPPIFWHYCFGPIEVRVWREPMPPLPLTP